MTQTPGTSIPHISTTTVMIKADPTGFAPGSIHTGTITYIAALVSADTTSVTMNVTNPPTVTAAPKSLSFSYTQGSSILPTAQNIAVSSTPAGATFSASASTTSGGNWLSVPTKNGTTPGSVPVSVDVTNLPFGLYSGTVTVTSGGAPVAVPVTLNILPASEVVISPGGVVPIYSTSTSIQAGSWISIFGTNLA